MTGNRREPPDWDNVMPLHGNRALVESALRTLAEIPAETAYWLEVRADVLNWAREVRREQHPPIVEEW